MTDLTFENISSFIIDLFNGLNELQSCKLECISSNILQSALNKSNNQLFQ